MNHYPIFRRKVPATCGASGDTANPFAHIDCPKCRAFLVNAVDAKTAGAMAFKSGSAEREMFLKNATMFQGILDQ